MVVFTPGLELCRRFYEKAVHPLLEQHFPDLPYAAALIGPGSDVLGFDTEMPMDHFWGPRLQIFLRDQDIPFASRIDEILRNSLPHLFEGFPVDVIKGLCIQATSVCSEPLAHPVVHNSSHPSGKSGKQHSAKPTRFSPICITHLLLPANCRKLFQTFITAPSKLSKRMCLFKPFLNRSQIPRSHLSRSDGSLETSINSAIVLICVMPPGEQCCVDCMSENETP